MQTGRELWKNLSFRQVLRQELELATGCTEPIAIAYAAALAQTLAASRAVERRLQREHSKER